MVGVKHDRKKGKGHSNVAFYDLFAFLNGYWTGMFKKKQLFEGDLPWIKVLESIHMCL